MAQPANQGANPLDQLRDIQVPDPLQSWAIAPGWWVLIALLLIVISYLAYRWFKRRKALRLLKPANIELQNIAQLVPDNHAIALLSALLKRVCLVYFSKKDVAALSGSQWVDFLNQHTRQPTFNEASRKIFAEVAYRPNQVLDDSLWQQIIMQSESAIDIIIRNGAKEAS